MKGILLKPRLAALAEMLPPGGVVADIGTDHAYLPLYLVLQGKARRVIAVENRPTTFAQARRSLAFFPQAAGKIELRLGDGLQPLRREDGVTDVVIAGMGGRSICGILGGAPGKWGWFRTMLLQPMDNAPLLRRWLAAHGLRLLSERLVREKKRFYEIMAVSRGRQIIKDPFFFELGPCLVENKDPLLVPFLREKIKQCRAIAEALQKSPRRESEKKGAYYRWKEARLKEALQHVGNGAENY